MRGGYSSLLADLEAFGDPLDLVADVEGVGLELVLEIEEALLADVVHVHEVDVVAAEVHEEDASLNSATSTRYSQ